MSAIPKFRADMSHAREIAELVLAGSMTPRQGCARIAEVSFALEGPEEIAPFELLNHEQTGHEHSSNVADSKRFSPGGAG
jgi:hypothetical protein